MPGPQGIGSAIGRCELVQYIALHSRGRARRNDPRRLPLHRMPILTEGRDLVATPNTTSGEANAADGSADLQARLREIRHRFRNSLQFLNSLVGLHARGIPDPQARAAFADLRVRLVALSWIYDTLDDDYPDGAKLAEFLPRVGQHIAGLGDREGRFRLSFDVAPVTVDHRSAAVISQILAELLTGLYRQAFSAAKGGTARVRLRRAADRLELQVSIPHPNDGSTEPAVADKLGMAIVRGLALSLGGSFETTHDGEDRAIVFVSPRF